MAGSLRPGQNSAKGRQALRGWQCLRSIRACRNDGQAIKSSHEPCCRSPTKLLRFGICRLRQQTWQDTERPFWRAETDWVQIQVVESPRKPCHDQVGTRILGQLVELFEDSAGSLRFSHGSVAVINCFGRQPQEAQADGKWRKMEDAESGEEAASLCPPTCSKLI